MLRRIPPKNMEVPRALPVGLHDQEEETESFSELAKIRNTLAHRYLDLKWGDIKRFLQIAPRLYPPFLSYIKREIERE